MNQQNETFEYTYSAMEQEEIQKIKNKYLPKEETKLDKLKKLDASVTTRGTIWSIALGVVGSLVFGSGMSAVMVLGTDLTMFVVGIVLGLLGMLLMGIAYPIYKTIIKKERARIAPQILALTEEIEAEGLQ